MGCRLLVISCRLPDKTAQNGHSGYNFCCHPTVKLFNT